MRAEVPPGAAHNLYLALRLRIPAGHGSGLVEPRRWESPGIGPSPSRLMPDTATCLACPPARSVRFRPPSR